jgi:hypothetical protein
VGWVGLGTRGDERCKAKVTVVAVERYIWMQPYASEREPDGQNRHTTVKSEHGKKSSYALKFENVIKMMR